MQITETKYNYEIRFGFNRRILKAVKELPDRRFMYNEKFWTVPRKYEAEVRGFADRFGFTFVGEEPPEKVGAIPPMPDLIVKIPLKLNLFSYQEQGVAYAMAKKRLIIGDQPGLGKTAQAIASVVATKAFPCLVICPASLKINWEREWQLWTNCKVMIMNNGIVRTWHLFHETGMVDVFIVNYESLKKYFVEDIKKEPGKTLRLNQIHFTKRIGAFKSIIIDEAHRIKDTSSQQAKFTKGLCMGKEMILALTGTPVVNQPRDLVGQLGILDRIKDLGGYRHFMKRYCQGEDGAANLNELHYKLRTTCFYRRDKSEVLKDLPPKTRQSVMCEIDTSKEYQDAMNDLAEYLVIYKNATNEQVQRSMRGEVMVRIGVCKNISARGKLKDVGEYVSDVMASGEKLVLFVHLKEVAGYLKKKYPGAVTILGEDSMAERQASIDAFQNDPKTQLIICSIKAAGVGITLTASSRVSFVELPWHPADAEQCEDRCHRIGTKDNVQCTYFLGKETIDEWIYGLINDKRQIANTITGAKDDVETFVISNIDSLINFIKVA